MEGLPARWLTTCPSTSAIFATGQQGPRPSQSLASLGRGAEGENSCDLGKAGCRCTQSQCGLESHVCQVFVLQGVRPLTCVSTCILGKSQPHPCPGTHPPPRYASGDAADGRQGPELPGRSIRLEGGAETAWEGLGSPPLRMPGPKEPEKDPPDCRKTMEEGWEHPLQPEGKAGWDWALTDFPGSRSWEQEAESHSQQCTPLGSRLSAGWASLPFCSWLHQNCD